MKILLISTSFNSMTQRAFTDLREAGHEVTVELSYSPDLMREAVQLFKPDVIFCPFLKQVVPEDIWKSNLTIIMHPGIVGDRGPSSIDWAIMENRNEWGMTALEADEEMDAGDIWSTHNFKLPLAPKSYVYRTLVIEAGMKGIFAVLDRLATFSSLAAKAQLPNALHLHSIFPGSAKTNIGIAKANFRQVCSGLLPLPLRSYESRAEGRVRPLMKQANRRVHWEKDTTEAVVRKIHAADGFPGVLDTIDGGEYFMFGAHFEDELGRLTSAACGDIIATRHGAICRKTSDGAVWITHLKRKSEETASFKLPATMVLPASSLDGVPASPVDVRFRGQQRTFKEIWYSEQNGVGYLFWEFHNGAMSTEQCKRLEAAIHAARKRPTKILVFMGGRNFWSNGIHLNVIEAASDPALESWRNINAMDDVVLAILSISDRLTISAIGANAGAGGVMLALATDKVIVRDGVILNPHYKAMGLYGSEYWTYSLPKRVGLEKATELTNSCLPINSRTAAEIGMVDDILTCKVDDFEGLIMFSADALADSAHYSWLLARKQFQRARDEAQKPLSLYRHEELAEMRENFWGSESTYHDARKSFVYKIDCGQTPLRLAKHRQISSAAAKLGVVCDVTSGLQNTGRMDRVGRLELALETDSRARSESQ